MEQTKKVFTVHGLSAGAYRFIYIENKVRILDEVDPEAQRKTVGFPGVQNLKNSYLVNSPFNTESIGVKYP